MPPFLQAAQVPIPFSGGVETKQDSKQVPPARLLDLQNGVFTNSTTISKRNGYRALARTIEAAGADYSDPRGIGVRDDEAVVFAAAPDGQPHAYSHRPSANRWSDTGRVESVVATERALVKTGTEQSQVDAATANGVTAVAWKDSRGGVWHAVVEEATGRVLKAPSQLYYNTPAADAGWRWPRVVAISSVLHIYAADTGAKRIYVTIIDTANPTTAVVPSVLTDDLGSPAVGGPFPAGPDSATYDACPVDSTAALIAWKNDLAGYRVGYVDITGVLGSALTGHPGVGWKTTATVQGPIATAFHDDAVVVVYSDAATATMDWYAASSFAATTASNTRAAFAGGLLSFAAVLVTSGAFIYLWVAFEQTAISERDHIVTLEGWQEGDASADYSTTKRGLCLASRAFAVDGRPMVFCAHDAPFFSVYLGLSMVDATCFARTMPIIAHGRAAQGWTSSVTVDPNDVNRWRVPLLYNEQLEAVVGEFAETGIRWVTLDFDAPEAWQTAQLGRGLYLAGACPQHYDGDRWAEMGFHYAPDGGITGVVSSGGSVKAGTYTYKATYEEIDAAGEVHRGPESVGDQVVVSGTDRKVTLTIPTYRLTGRRRVRISVWRAPVATGSVFFRVSSVDPAASGSNGYVANNPDADTVSFDDAMADEDLIEQEELYTNGGVLSNDPAPMSGACLAVGKNRLFWTDPAEPDFVRFSQELADGFAVEPAAPLAIRLDPYGGKTVGVAVMDDIVYPFKERAIYLIAGPGPTAAPDVDRDASFSQPALVTGDVGLADPRSIAATPIGLAFKSNKGIQLIDRSRQLISVGDAVEGYDAFTVKRATLMPNTSRILFLTDDDAGRALLYDYEHKQWSTFTNHLGLDAAVVGGVYQYLRTDGRVFVETPGVYRDDNSQIRMVLVTAWIKLVPYLQGWHRFWDAYFIGEYISAHTLRIRFGLDYEPGFSAPFDLDVNANYDPTPYGEGAYGSGPYGGGTGSSRYQRKLNLGKRGQAIRFRIEDVEATGAFGASVELSELLLTGAVVRNAVKLEGARSS